MSIDCCKDCVPPKRHMNCHSTCPEYKKQKKVHDAERDASRKKQNMEKAALDIRLRRHNKKKKGNHR